MMSPGWLRRFACVALSGAFALSLASCNSSQTYGDDDLNLDGADQTAPADSAGGADDFSDFDEDAGEKQAAIPEAADPGAAAANAEGDELSLDDPPAETSPAEAPQVAENPAETPAEPTPEPTPEPAPVAEAPPPEPAPEAAPEPTPAPESAPVASHGGNSNITSVRYRANDNGGTVVIEGDGPLTYTTRANPELRQLIVEVPNSVLPKRLQRPLNTRDIQGSIGGIDPYQHAGSSVSRFVIQLRPGAGDPVVQQEGHAILIVANSPPPKEEAGVDLTREAPVNMENFDEKVLASQSLSDFLAGNNKFYGKRISIEVDNIDVRQALRFLTEESGVNMVVADEVRGSVSLKLRQVPWDQALVMIMKAKRLGYTRQGNVLRIATQEQLKQEEDDATKLAASKRTVEPLKVRMFPISYAQVADLEKRVVNFLGERGKVTGDARTNSLVVTDIEDNLGRVAKLIQSLDTQPPQVLIEAKIIEATEAFTRSVGVNWNFTGQDIRLGRSSTGQPANLRPTLDVNPGIKVNAANFGLSLGTIDFLGDLSATLALQEQNETVKVISAPRISTLSNETANIQQTTEVPVRQVNTAANGQTQNTFTFKPLQMRLEVTPQITSDASIIMKVLVKREFQGADLPGGGFPVNSREASTRVIVRNGQTAVIGGIYQSDAQDGETGVPYLRSIPFLGALFRGQTTKRQKNELMIFLTPRVAQTNPEGGKAASDL